MKKRKKTGKVRKDPNYLPEHIGKAMERELDVLIDILANEPNPKARYLKEEYKSKYVSDDTAPPIVRREAALAKWLAAEERNFTTNQRIWLRDEADDFGWITAEALVEKASEIIRSVLGDCNSFRLSGGSHSNGASTRVKRSPKAAILKHSGQAHVSSSALGHWVLDSAANSILQRCELKIRESSVFFTVPKSTDIDRVACKEPEINMFMQREVGMHIRRRLRKRGIDLRDQSRNQRLAASAKTAGNATIDLSSASDSISIELVRALLPFEWFCLLDDLRVKTVEIDGDLHTLQMFSSMGNGFTFELETLIFYALTSAVCWASGVKSVVSVYGDDIICSSKIARRLARVFSWFGFIVNSKKSNWSGPLRESCGKHYHNSWDVTPFYLRRPIRCKTDVIRVLNRLLQWSSEGTGVILNAHVLLYHKKWSKQIPLCLTGGQDPSLDSCLVTGTPLKGFLLRKAKPLDFPQESGLDWWLTTKRTSPERALVCYPAEAGAYMIHSDFSNQDLLFWDEELSCVVQCPSKTSRSRSGSVVSPYLLESYLLRPDTRVGTVI